MLEIPNGHDAQLAHARQQQKFFAGRFPGPEEFVAFLRANSSFVFDERSFYECSMAYCGGGSVSEGYGSDIDINAPPWFRTFEKLTLSRQYWAGVDLIPIVAQAVSQSPEPSTAIPQPPKRRGPLPLPD